MGNEFDLAAFCETEILVQVETTENNDDDIDDNYDNDDDDRTGGQEREKKVKNSRNIKSKENNSFLPDLEQSDYSWSNESTYLKPNIPILKPFTFKMTSLHESIQVENSASKSVNSLSVIIKDSVKTRSNLYHENQVCPFQV